MLMRCSRAAAASHTTSLPHIRRAARMQRDVTHRPKYFRKYCFVLQTLPGWDRMQQLFGDPAAAE